MGIFDATTCRLCATQTDTNIPIFTGKPADTGRQLSSLGLMMRDCLFDEITPTGGYPDVVCQFCQLQLNVFFEFKKKVLEHHRKFTAALLEHKSLPAHSKPAASTKPSNRRTARRRSSSEDVPTTIATTALAIKCEAKRELDEEYADSNDDAHQTEEEFIDEHYLDDPDEVSHPEFVSINRPTSDSDDADVDAHSMSATDVLDDGITEDESKFDVDQISIHIDVDSTIADEETANHTSQFDQDYDADPSHEDDPPAAERTNSIADTPFVYDGDEDDELEMLVEYIDDDVADNGGDGSDGNGGDQLPADLASLVEGLPNIVPDVVRVMRCGQVVEALECPECDEIVLTAQNFEQHVQKKHRVRVKCKQCGQVIYSDYIQRHMLKHRPVRAFRCAICAKSFTTLSQCAAHEFRHTNQRPLECAICQKRFKLKCDLRIHMAGHGAVRKYECDLCDKAFRMRSHLVDHRETHNTVRTISCDQCPLLFKTSVTLRSHVRQVHTADHQFKCALCNRGFYRRHKLDRHMLGHEKRGQTPGDGVPAVGVANLN